MTLPPEQLEALKREASEFVYKKLLNKEADHPEAVNMLIDHLAATGRLLPENITNKMMKAGLEKARPILNLPDTQIEAALYHAFNAMITAAQGE